MVWTQELVLLNFVDLTQKSHLKREVSVEELAQSDWPAACLWGGLSGWWNRKALSTVGSTIPLTVGPELHKKAS